MVYEDFGFRGYTINGTASGTYNMPMNVLGSQFKFDIELSYVDRNGIPFRLEEHWRMENVEVTVDVVFERPGNTETRAVKVPIATLLGSF